MPSVPTPSYPSRAADTRCKSSDLRRGLPRCSVDSVGGGGLGVREALDPLELLLCQELVDRFRQRRPLRLAGLLLVWTANALSLAVTGISRPSERSGLGEGSSLSLSSYGGAREFGVGGEKSAAGDRRRPADSSDRCRRCSLKPSNPLSCSHLEFGLVDVGLRDGLSKGNRRVLCDLAIMFWKAGSSNGPTAAPRENSKRPMQRSKRID